MATTRALSIAFLVVACSCLAGARVLNMQVQPKGGLLFNWNLTYNTTYGISVKASSVEDIRSIIMDSKTYPSPVLAVGNMHSVTPIMTNPDGTIINLLGFNKVLQLDPAAMSVTVEAGITLADLHDYLAQQGYEISFMPEIGDATVGSLAVTTSKDSSVRGPGYLSGLIKELTYVNADGKLATLKKGTPEFDLFTASWGVAGIVTSLTLEIRPLTLVSTELRLVQFDPAAPSADLKFAETLRTLKKQSDNIFITTDPNTGWAFVEMRSLAQCSGQKHCHIMLNNPLNQMMLELVRRLKYDSFLVGALPADLLNIFGPIGSRMPFPVAVTHYRKTLVNRYPKVTKSDKRLDFTYFEFQDSDNLDLFVGVYTSALQFVREYAAKTGFKPGGLATYFVNRPGTKKHGSYRGSAGTSFMLDPVTGTPDDARWYDFLTKFNEFVFKKKTALFALSQTKLITRAQLAEQKGLIPKAMASKRFTTPFLAEFVADS